MISEHTAKLTVYLPKIVLDAVKMRAKIQNRTVSNYVTWVLEGELDLRPYSYQLSPDPPRVIENLKRH